MRPAFYLIARAFTSIAIGFVLFSAPNATRADDSESGEVVGFEDAHGKTIYLHDFKGKPVIINIWATWCGPCVQEMPSLAKLQEEHGKDLTVIAISEDDSIETAIAFYKDKGITSLTPYIDKSHEVWMALQPRGIPTTVLVKRDGTMAQRIEGPLDWQSVPLQPILTHLLEK